MRFGLASMSESGVMIILGKSGGRGGGLSTPAA